MAKVLKIVGTVVAVVGLAVVTAGASIGLTIAAASGLTVAGISAGALILAGGLLSTVGSALSAKQKGPAASSASTDRLTVSIDLRATRKTIFGHTAMATDLRDQEVSTDQTYVHRFVLAAAHRVHSIEQIWFDDKLAWTSAGGVQSTYAGYLTVTTVLEGSAGNAINIGARMGSARRYTGCAYVYFRYKLTGNSSKATSPFSSSIPTRVTIIGSGAYLYDPRLDSTVGGSGSMRADDQTTWTAAAWSDDRARNPALQALWYLLGWRIFNTTTGQWVVSVGKGIPASRIDMQSFIDGANLCDELVTVSAGGTEPRYRSDGIFQEGDELSTVLDNLKVAMNADLDDVDGRIRLQILHNDLAAPIGSLTTDDVLGAFTWDQTPPLSDKINVIRGTYVDPSTTSLYQSVDYPQVKIDSPDGIDRVLTLNFQMVQSASQAQRLAKAKLRRSMYGGTFQATFQATAWKYQKGDAVAFTFAPLGWTDKLFRIADMTIQVDGTVPMILREEHEEIYDDEATDAAPIVGAEPTTYDPLLSPIVLAIGDAEAQIAAIASDNVLSRGSEKQAASIDWTAIVNEKASLDAKYAALDSPPEYAAVMADLGTKVSALADYLNSLSPAWNDVTVDTEIEAATWVARWNDAYDALAAARTAIIGRAGASATTLIAGANVVIGPGTIEKVSGGGSWNAGAYSAQGYAGDVIAVAQVTDTGAQAMIGLNSDPATDDGYWSIDYAVYNNGSEGRFEAWESNAWQGNFGTLNVGDFVYVRRRGNKIEYGVLGEASPRYIKPDPVDPAVTLYFDCSIVNEGYKWVNCSIQPVGSDGEKGEQGENGIDALNVSALPNPITVACSANGTPKAAIPGFQISATQGASDVTGTASYSFTSSGLSGVSDAGGGTFTVAGMSADTGSVTVTVSNAGSSATITVTYTKSKDGAAFVNDSATIGAPGTSYGVVSSISLLMGPDGTIEYDLNGSFSHSGGGSTNVDGYVEYSLDGGSTWTSGDSFTGNAAVGAGDGDFSLTSGLDGATIGLATRQTVTLRVQMKKNGGPAFSSFAGGFAVQWTG